MTDETDDAPVPKLPRGKGIKLGTAELFRIAITILFLIAVIMLTKPCSQAVSTFVVGFGSGSGSGTGSGSGSGSAKVDPYERLTPGMTEQQVKDAIERSKAKNAALSGSGSSPSPSPISGSAAGSAAAGSGAAGSGSNTLAPAMNPTLQRRSPAPVPTPATPPTAAPTAAPTTNP